MGRGTRESESFEEKMLTCGWIIIIGIMEVLQEIDIRSPQLDYFIAYQNTAKDAPNGRQDPAIVQQFIDRYNYGHVGHKEKLDDYLNDQPIQKVLEVYRIDPEKFWYYLLFATDYAEGMGSFFSPNPSPLEQFEKVFPLIEANLQPHVFPQQGGYVFKDDSNMKLTLTVKKPGMKRSSVVDIFTPNAFALLVDIYRRADKSDPLFQLAIGGSYENQIPLVAQRLACFYTIVMTILKPITAQKGVDRDTPIDKGYLVSQLAYLMELTPPGDTRFIDPMNCRYLHDYVKAYLSDKMMGINEHYNYDFLADE